MAAVPRPSRASLVVFACMLLWLAAIDALVNRLYGGTPRPGVEPAALSRYFDYGRSVEGKLARMVADPAGLGLILDAGWIDAGIYRHLPDQPAPGKDLLVAVYGQSFALNAANAAAQADGRITLRPVGGPAAPPNHSYAAYQVDAPLRKADVTVLGILSASVPHMGSMSGLIWMFESPAAFTFPRYRVQDGKLVAVQPLIRSQSEFSRAFAERGTAWASFEAQLAANDRGFDRFSFDASALDQSAVVRLIRRGWVAHRQGYDTGVYEPGVGFRTDAEELQALRLILRDWKRRADERGERFVVLLLHTRGQADHLYTALAPTLNDAGIDAISTHTLFSANDPSNFQADGHYVDAANAKLAAALRDHIRAAGPGQR